MLYERYEGMAHNWPDCRQVNLVLRVTHSQGRLVWGPPLDLMRSILSAINDRIDNNDSNTTPTTNNNNIKKAALQEYKPQQ